MISAKKILFIFNAFILFHWVNNHLEDQRSLCNSFLENKVAVNGACSDGSHLFGWISFLQFFVMLKNRLCFEGFFILRWLYNFSYVSLMYLLPFFHIEAKSPEKLNAQFLLNHKTESLVYWIWLIGWFTFCSFCYSFYFNSIYFWLLFLT